MFLAVAVLGTVSAFAQGAETELAGETMHQILMQKFLEGGWGWMMPVLVCLVIGLLGNRFVNRYRAYALLGIL